MLTFGTVICTYNRPQLLEQCLASWSGSSHLPDQFIVVDATPGAEQYSSQIIQKFPQLFANFNSHYIVTDKPGLTRQRNLGLKQLKTDVVCFADDDTFVSRDYLSKILEVFQADTQGAIGGVNGTASGQFDN
ncbi:MAG: glycosyltransferase family 2 protein, partial [Oscillatoriales cyanobacterium C42_A2020_001]|nr:glycosyltransferase family 2 protein [Leptolyngbyaceae cyanobacterium C42_A2020_001]